MSYFNMVCDCCGREVYSCNIVNGMKFCAKCYQETFGNEQKYIDMLHKESSELLINSLAKKDQQIAELQKQLEEKEKEMAKLRELRAIKDDASQCVVVNGVKFSYEQILIIQDMNYNYDMKIKNLKQQLKSQPAEIVEKIGGEIYTRMVVECKETKYTDINLILDTILKEYQK